MISETIDVTIQIRVKNIILDLNELGYFPFEIDILNLIVGLELNDNQIKEIIGLEIINNY